MLSDCMKTPILAKLREVLASISHEEFLSQWAEIEQDGCSGPTAKELIASFSCPAIGQSQQFQLIMEVRDFSIIGEYNFAMAA